MVRYYCDVCKKEITEENESWWQRTKTAFAELAETLNPSLRNPNLDIVGHLPGINHLCNGCKDKLIKIDIPSVLHTVISNVD